MPLPFKGPRGTDPSPHQTPETHGPNSISQANGKAKPGPKRVGIRNTDDRLTWRNRKGDIHLSFPEKRNCRLAGFTKTKQKKLGFGWFWQIPLFIARHSFFQPETQGSFNPFDFPLRSPSKKGNGKLAEKLRKAATPNSSRNLGISNQSNHQHPIMFQQHKHKTWMSPSLNKKQKKHRLDIPVQL